MQRILIIGAGGHGQVVADALLQMQANGSHSTPIGFIDNNLKIQTKSYLGLPVLGTQADLYNIEHEAIVIAIGNNNIRRQLFQNLHEQGQPFATVIHPRAIVAPDVKIGSGTMIMAGVIINCGSTIGENVILNTGCTVDHHNKIAAHVHIAPGAHLGGEVSAEEGAFIGLGASILPRTTIGAWSIVGAGACVIESVPPEQTVVGVPAKQLKS